MVYFSESVTLLEFVTMLFLFVLLTQCQYKFWSSQKLDRITLAIFDIFVQKLQFGFDCSWPQ